MTRTSLDHQMVRSYISKLNVALRGVPTVQAHELRDQIMAHIDEALPPDADDEQIAVVLGRLGSPAELAADVQASSAPPTALAMIRTSLRYRLAQVPRRAWSFVGVIAVVAGIATGYLIYFLTPGSLEYAGASGWWYPQDYSHEVTTTADGATQTTVPLRSGDRQGYVITINNPTGVTQTILGPAYGPGVPWNSPGSPVAQIEVSVPNLNIDHGGTSRSVRFTLPGAIPPGQTREVRVLWISNICSTGGTTCRYLGSGLLVPRSGADRAARERPLATAVFCSFWHACGTPPRGNRLSDLVMRRDLRAYRQPTPMPADLAGCCSWPRIRRQR